MEQTTILQAININFYYGKQHVLKNINFSIEQNKFVSIIGLNGSGKTTLFNLMCGYTKPYSGYINYKNRNINQMSILERAKEFAVIHQKEDSFPFTCIETVILGLYPHRARFGKLNDNQLQSVKSVMELTDTYKFADKLVNQISGGELQRLNLARALLQNPKILFMDEAMSELDICTKIKMTKVLKNLISQKGISVVAINHDINTAYKFSDTIIALKDGQIRAIGSPKSIMTEPFFKDVFEVEAEIFYDKGFFITNNIGE